MKTEENDSLPSKTSVASLVLTGGAVILDVATTGGALTLVSGLAALAVNRLDAEEMRSLLDRTASIEERTRALEASRARVRRITGDRVKVLAATLEAQANELFGLADADAVMGEWSLSPDQYRKAAEELKALGIVRVHPGGNHPSGISRTALEPEAFLRVAPAMLEDVSVADEFLRVLRTVYEAEDEMVPANDVLEESGVPPPRFDLYVQAGEALDLLKGSSDGVRPYPRYFWLAVTSLGRRVVRGEDPVPVGPQ